MIWSKSRVLSTLMTVAFASKYSSSGHRKSRKEPVWCLVGVAGSEVWQVGVSVCVGNHLGGQTTSDHLSANHRHTHALLT